MSADGAESAPLALPDGWQVLEEGADLLLACFTHQTQDFRVELRRLDGEWSATVTRVRDGQRHRIATAVGGSRPAALDTVMTYVADRLT
jgi:hypothetical protein